ncbi:hypothetical protein AZF37_09275 [endosymbiont 'TC1' of Trimyema compressum]|uniref:hypothetical protein n=1 Tax=endosymbiont 'TC1' of Trimyema compressum TaxID=243899 RepID=UPI0007F04C90|nr:hypothetical protein [endosymbiont 'TC1' of Trimyema compressum]AMP21309.1 hypothetical protein AZF37_09275 [endosymbiont 'TC1' of Trimyema compressum]
MKKLITSVLILSVLLNMCVSNSLFAKLQTISQAVPDCAISTDNEPINAVSQTSVTFAQQFPNRHTAEVIAARFNRGADSEITDDIISKCTDLPLRNSELTDISGIEIFANLARLDLFSNDLTTLPDSIGSLLKLSNLILTNNQLKTLPDSMKNLSNLFL